MAYLTLITGLLISAVAIFYSVAGLTSIFSAAVIPIIIMGATLEVAKLVATVWLKQNWALAPRFLKGYLLGAIAILMFITSMGIFGFLSKAHSDQTLVSGDVQSKIAVYDEKIKTAKDNIDANRKALKQMDEAVDQVMGRSSDEKGADKAVAIRRGQQKERTRLQAEIASEQKIISQLSEERAPIAAEVRKVEAEVGPIKYIAAFVYGDNTDANVLEKAVTWVIILIVIVFDPLAVMLLLASQYTFTWAKKPEEDSEEDVEEWFRQGRERARELDADAKLNEEFADTPIPSFLLKKDIDLDAINQELAEAVERTEPQLPEVEEEEEQFVIEVPESINVTNTDNPTDTPKPLAFGIDVMDRPGDYIITHTATGTTIQDSAGTQEISTVEEVNDSDLTFRELVDKYGYSSEKGIYKVHGKDYTTEEFNSRMEDDGYVQNEEQSESGIWSKIVNKTITEDQYLNEAQKRQPKKDV